ncbi:uncharacterized protein [Lepisosteus oculatus]|uniref:uncharacterized protein isoform X2 n=1 Tax=Lepisosteus oculatus TaxID=7918 RepID=UPI0037101430
MQTPSLLILLSLAGPVSKPEVRKTPAGRALVTQNCSLLCSVQNGREVTLSWYREGEEKPLSNTSSLNLNSTLTLPLETDGQYNNTYSCVASNPVSVQTTRVKPETYCPGSDTEARFRNRAWVLVSCALLLCLALMTALFILMCKKRRDERQSEGCAVRGLSVDWSSGPCCGARPQQKTPRSALTVHAGMVQLHLEVEHPCWEFPARLQCQTPLPRTAAWNDAQLRLLASPPARPPFTDYQSLSPPASGILGNPGRMSFTQRWPWPVKLVEPARGFPGQSMCQPVSCPGAVSWPLPLHCRAPALGSITSCGVSPGDLGALPGCNKHITQHTPYVTTFAKQGLTGLSSTVPETQTARSVT